MSYRAILRRNIVWLYLQRGWSRTHFLELIAMDAAQFRRTIRDAGNFNECHIERIAQVLRMPVFALFAPDLVPSDALCAVKEEIEHAGNGQRLLENHSAGKPPVTESAN